MPAPFISVWRLDAPNAALAKGLVDEAMYGEAKSLAGTGCFDRNRGDLSAIADFSYGAGDWETHRAAEFSRQAGFPVIEDDHSEEFGTPPAPLRCDRAAGATTEPYLDNLPHPDQAFLYLFQGANVGDALLRSERLLKWNIINIGDPHPCARATDDAGRHGLRRGNRRKQACTLYCSRYSPRSTSAPKK